jgi:TrkA-N domain
VVEQDQRVIQALCAQAWLGVTALVGDAANPVLLERMHLAQARLLVAAIPDALAVRAVVDYARRHYAQMEQDVDRLGETRILGKRVMGLRRQYRTPRLGPRPIRLSVQSGLPAPG